MLAIHGDVGTVGHNEALSFEKPSRSGIKTAHINKKKALKAIIRIYCRNSIQYATPTTSVLYITPPVW